MHHPRGGTRNQESWRCAEIAQWQSGRLWTDRTQVRALLSARFRVAQWQSGRLSPDWTQVRALPLGHLLSAWFFRVCNARSETKDEVANIREWCVSIL